MRPVTAPVPPSRTAPPAAVRAVPVRMRWVCGISAAVVVAVMLVVAVLLRHSSVGVVHFAEPDQFAIAGIGVALGAGILFLARSRVEADAAGLRVQNIVGRYELPWTMVDAIVFYDDSAWATVQLVTGEEMSVLAIQAVDKERAVATVEGLRALHAAALPPQPPKPPLLYDD